MLLKKITVGICASVLTAGMATAADLSGKTVEWTIPFSETGGSAKWANFFAPLLSEALPGNPTVVVKYMPGAGSTKGANWFQRQKDGDGTVMFGSSGSTQFPYLLDTFQKDAMKYLSLNAISSSLVANLNKGELINPVSFIKLWQYFLRTFARGS